MGEETKIRLKFCGGCNPGYARVDAAEKIARACRGRVELVGAEAATVEGVLLLAGCPTACPDLSAYPDLPVWRVCDENDIGRICREMGEFAGHRNPD